MAVSKFLYVALLNFNLMLLTLCPSILFHDKFTEFSMLSAKIGERRKQVTARYIISAQIVFPLHPNYQNHTYHINWWWRAARYMSTYDKCLFNRRNLSFCHSSQKIVPNIPSRFKVHKFISLLFPTRANIANINLLLWYGTYDTFMKRLPSFLL